MSNYLVLLFFFAQFPLDLNYLCVCLSIGMLFPYVWGFCFDFGVFIVFATR